MTRAGSVGLWHMRTVPSGPIPIAKPAMPSTCQIPSRWLAPRSKTTCSARLNDPSKVTGAGMVSASSFAAHAMQSVPCGTYAPGARYVFDALLEHAPAG